MLILIGIWVLSFLAVFPTLMYNGTYNFYLPNTDLVLYHVCAEFWPSSGIRFAFTAFLMFIQYVIPITVILITHMKIISIVKLRINRVNHLRKASQGLTANVTTLEPVVEVADFRGTRRFSWLNFKRLFSSGQNGQGKCIGSQVGGRKASQSFPSTIRRNKKTTQILLIIAICFGISWLPYHCFMISKC